MGRTLVNTAEFSREAQKFVKHGHYCDAPPGTIDYNQYWREQKKRCVEGYSVAGVRITGRHYFYLNFVPILKTGNKEGVGQGLIDRLQSFPDFWDGDYEFFWVLDIARNGISQKEYESLGLDTRVLHLNGGKHLSIIKGRGKGYAQPLSEVVQTPRGPICIGDIRVGDHVIGSSGMPTLVTEIHPQGSKEVVEVRLRDRRSVRCSWDHLWTVIDFKGNKRTLSTRDLANVKLIKNQGQSNQYYHWYLENHGAEYDEKILPLDPYLLGVLIGDGTLSGGSIVISAKDNEILHYAEEGVPEGHWINKGEGMGHSLVSGKGKPNKVLGAIRGLGLDVNQEHRFIPEEYFLTSREQRMELLRGLMDSDGSCTASGACKFGTSSRRLMDDFIRLLQGLGIRYYESPVINPDDYDTWSVLPHYSINITTNKPIFKIGYKLKNIKTDRKYGFNKIPIVDIVSLGYEEEQVCITVEAEDSLYQTTGHVITHNSYKTGSIPSYEFVLGSNTKTFALANEKEYLIKDGVLSKAWETIDFQLKSGAAWAQPSIFNTDMYRKAGYKQKTPAGIWVEKGKGNEIFGISMRGDPQKARGKRGGFLIFEEGGKFPNLAKAWEIARPSVEQGKNVFGTLIAFGTGGSNEGDMQGLESLFMNPDQNNCLPFENIWDEAGGRSGFFVSAAQNFEGFMDGDGNSNMQAATEHILHERELRKQGTDPEALPQYTAENPLTPQDALLMTETNLFPVHEIKDHLNVVNMRKLYNQLSNCMLVHRDGQVKMVMDGIPDPVSRFPTTAGQDLRGCVQILEPPVKVDGKVPENLYVVVNDPYGKDKTVNKGSLGASYVIKMWNNFSTTYMGCIVAAYVGRPDTLVDYNQQLFMLAEMYNARIGFESNQGHGVLSYARENRLLHKLIPKPVLGSRSTRGARATEYGIHMTEELKDAAEIYLRDWFSATVYSGDGREIKRLHTIPFPGLLSEALKFNRKKGNFDRIMALMVGMFFVQDMRATKEVAKKNDKLEALNRMFEKELF